MWLHLFSPSKIFPSETNVAGVALKRMKSLQQIAAVLLSPVPEFIDPRFRENKPKTLIFSHRKLAFWACFRENMVYNFRHCRLSVKVTNAKLSNSADHR
jgi:hypothetical protein